MIKNKLTFFTGAAIPMFEDNWKTMCHLSSANCGPYLTNKAHGTHTLETASLLKSEREAEREQEARLERHLNHEMEPIV